MRLLSIGVLALGFLFMAGSVAAEEPATNTGTSTPESSTRPYDRPQLKERAKGAQDQFLQHQAQVKERAAELKQNAATRMETIRTQVFERRATVKENVAELKATNPEDRGALMRERLEERKAMLMEKRASFASSTAERREKVSEKRSELTTARFDQAIRLMHAMVLRLSGLADRIEARISLLGANGADVTAAERSLDAARDSIEEAESSVNDLADVIASALASETPRESLAESRARAGKTKETIRAAYAALKNAAAALPRASAESGI